MRSDQFHGRPGLFALEFLHQLVVTDLVDASFAASINPTLANSFTPRIATEARDAGLDVAVSSMTLLPILRIDTSTVVSRVQTGHG